jgi:hypothetical protein
MLQMSSLFAARRILLARGANFAGAMAVVSSLYRAVKPLYYGNWLTIFRLTRLPVAT